MTTRLVSPDIAERAKNFGGMKASSGGPKPPRPKIFGEAPVLPKSSLLEQQAATRADAVVETPASRNRDRTPDANGSGNLSRMSNGTRRSTASHGQGQRPEHGGHDIKSSGIRVAYDGGCHRVEVIERGSSADLCGLIRKGDVLAKVDGRPAMDIFGMRGSARRVKGPEGSLVVLSLERDMQGMPPMPFEVELFYGTIPPERLMHVLENSTRELEQELELCRAQEELGGEIGRKLCMDKDANIVLEGRILAARNGLSRAEASLKRSSRSRDSWSVDWLFNRRDEVSDARDFYTESQQQQQQQQQQQSLFALCFGGMGGLGRPKSNGARPPDSPRTWPGSFAESFGDN